MITFKTLGVHGRAGNQLFQYACLYSVAKRNNYEFGVPYKNKHENPYFNFVLPEYFKNLSAKDCSYYMPQYLYEPPCWEYNDSVFNVKDNTEIRGYFQSEKYFTDYKEDIKKEFTFKDEIYEESLYKRNQISDPLIAIHVRIGDFKLLKGKHPICDEQYYLRALSLLPQDIPYIIFSDTPYEVHHSLKTNSRNKNLNQNLNEKMDMCLMSMCNYHIIANSTFSWWGAWLSNTNQVIAPAKWFGDELDIHKWSDLYCKNWIVI
jgi:hypothetical protein